ncbi:MAG: hypothetical protein WAQ53_07975 [Thiofilum sp.]|uniref:hypothetical protein n=1 Tax=Thiofilum sp. TaxID=2212733 RepID=UPI0025FFE882|nr:hypothetical protein [Thiofilum sp.]MBK8454119.1 hypothetical protein [Thiofilum sp.]
MTQNTLNDSQTVHDKLLAELKKADLRNQKGRDAIHSLIIKSHAVTLISDHVKANNGNREQYVSGLLALVNHYDCGASVSTRTLATQAAGEGLSATFLETKLIPLLLELGVIIRLSEKSYKWQIAEKIGTKPSFLEYFKPVLDIESTQALRKQQATAANEARLLELARKQALIAQSRKQATMQALNAAQEAERLAASLPATPKTPFDWAKANAMPLVIMVLLGAVVIGGILQPTGTPANSPQLAPLALQPSPTLSIQSATFGSAE